MVQPPVFHGHALGIFLEMEQPANEAKLLEALGGDHVTLAGTEDDDSQPSNVNTAGQPNIFLSLKNQGSWAKGILLWGGVHNLRVAAITSVGCPQNINANPPAGKNPMRPWHAACLALLAASAGCGYHTAGHAVQLPQNVKTIAVPAFVNETSTYRIEQLLTSSVVREFTKAGTAIVLTFCG